MLYRYGYVWTKNGRRLTDEREVVSRSDRRTVVSSEIMRQKLPLGYSKEVLVRILWREKVNGIGDKS